MTKKWLIWSIEHDAWWAENCQGYTKKRDKAGRYTFGEACRIVSGSNMRNDKPDEAMVRDE